MEAYEPFISLGLALVAGLLIGLEREQSAPDEEKQPSSFIGGVRTHPLFALLGALSMLLARQIGIGVSLLVLFGILAFLVVAYLDDVKRGIDRGLTSEAAFLLSFLLGALSLSERVFSTFKEKVIVVASVAVVATLLLSSKSFLHTFVQKTSKEDVIATVKFLIVAVVVLPLLPNETFGPLDVLNPFKIGLMVVLIAGISFVGYISIRLLGARRGIGLTGLVGGLASSTAVTLSFSDRAKKVPALAGSCALAVVLASSIMFGRVLIEVGVVNPALLQDLAIPTGAMTLTGLLASAFFFFRSRRQSKDGTEVRFSNPFELSSAIKFAFLFAVVLLISKAATTYFGSSVIYLTGLLAGLTDVDPITLSMAGLAGDQVTFEVASTTIFLGMASNTLSKAGMAILIGGWAFGRSVLLAFLAILASGAAGVAVVWFW